MNTVDAAAWEEETLNKDKPKKKKRKKTLGLTPTARVVFTPSLVKKTSVASEKKMLCLDPDDCKYIYGFIF